jgi:tubulin polyglutamylase TTLL4
VEEESESSLKTPQLEKRSNDLCKIYRGYLISKYVSNPHLINGLKYDLRVYVLVSSFDPLRVFIYDEGLVRFATEEYSTNIKDLTKKFVHLTNYSINKKAEKYVENKNNSDDEENSSKWSFASLKQKYAEIGVDWDIVWSRTKDIIIKTLISIEPHVVSQLHKSTPHRNQCFELFGFDILIDENLRPWLLEVRHENNLIGECVSFFEQFFTI